MPAAGVTASTGHGGGKGYEKTKRQLDDSTSNYCGTFTWSRSIASTYSTRSRLDLLLA